MTFKQIGYYLTSERDGINFKIEFEGEYFQIHLEKEGKKKWVYPYSSLELAKLDCENLKI